MPAPVAMHWQGGYLGVIILVGIINQKDLNLILFEIGGVNEINLAGEIRERNYL